VDVTATYIEVVGSVVNESSIKALTAISLDSEGELGNINSLKRWCTARSHASYADMKLVNDVIELSFESRFDKVFPRYTDST
jgi:replication factor A3